MSLAGLRYTSHGGSISGPQETKSGSYIYSGNPNGFFEWEFRTKVRVALHKQKHAKKKSEKTYSSPGSQSATPERSQRRPTHATEAGDVSEDDEARFEAFGTPKSESVAGEEEPALSTAGLDDDGAEYATLVHKVLEGLRGDAYLTAQDMGLEKLLTPTGIDELISRIRAQVFPLRQQEARELFRVGQLPHGPLSRQTTESMTSYISRRRRWWRKLLEMDDGVSLSDPMRGELLLEGSGLSKTEQLMIKTAAGDNQSFDVYAKFLLEFHGQIHLRSWSAFGNTSPRRQKGGGKFSGKSSYKGGKGRSWQRSAYVVEDDSWDYEESYEAEAEDDYEHEAYVAAEDEEPEDEEHEDYVEDPEVATALMAMGECDDEENDVSEELGSAAQHQMMAFVVTDQLKGKSKGKGKGSGKKGGKSKGKGKYVFRTQLSVQDRIARLAKLKSVSKCLRCGGKGHWAGDPACKFPKQNDKSPGGTSSTSKATAYFALSDDESSVEGEYMCVDVSGQTVENGTCYMAYKMSPKKKLEFEPSDRASMSSGVTSSPPSSFSMVEPNVRRSPQKSPPVTRRKKDMEQDLLPEGSQNVFVFGQHQGLTYHEVLFKYPGYYQWGSGISHPSRCLADFLTWVTTYYEVSQDGDVSLREHPLTDVPVEAIRRTGDKSAKGKPPNPPLEESCRRCTRFTFQGSNAYVENKTCLDCGKNERKKKESKPSADPAKCKHEVTDRRGSSKTTSRWYCKLCGTTVDEMPREEARKREAMAKSMVGMRTNAFDTTASMIENEINDACMSAEGTLEVLEMFRQEVECELEFGEPVRVGVLFEILANAVEVIREAAPETCYMGLLSDLNEATIENTLRLVDIMEDPGVWAVLDEGCNATVCGQAWIQNAKDKYARLGYDVADLQCDSKAFRGLAGDTKTLGKCRIPFALTFLDPETKLPGVMETHVVDGKIPLLLSQHAQAALHFTKSMGDAKCYVGNAELELCRARNSGLLCVNLSEGLKSLKSKRLPKQLRELKNTDYGMSFNIRPSDQLTAFMADEERPTRGTFTLDDPACVHVLTCGKEFNGQIASFDRSKSLITLGPILAQFDPGRRWLIFDCMGFGDPQHDPQLRSHVGTHPEIIRGMTGSEKTMEALLYGLHHLKACHEKGQQLAVIAYCRRNRHRSVSFGWLLATAFSKLCPRAHLTLTHSNQDHSWSQMSGTCKGKCAMCTHESHDALEAALRSRDYVLKQFGLKATPTYSHVGLVVFDSEVEARESDRRSQAPVGSRVLPPPPCPKKPPVLRPAVVKAASVAKAPVPVPKGTHTMSHRGPGSVRAASPDPQLAAATPKAPAPEAPATEAPAPEEESRYNEDAELRRRDKAETSRQAEPRGESVATSQPDAATQALLQTVELLTQQVKQMQEREYERRRSRSRDRRRRERSDSRDYPRGRRRGNSREYRRGRSRSLSRRRSHSFGRIPTPPKLIPREPEGPPPRWHYYGSGRGTSRDSEQSAWQERRFVPSSERPGTTHFPRATGAWPSHLEFPTVEGDGPWNRRVNLEHMPLELLDRIWDSVPDLGMKASRCALRWVGPFFPGSTSLTSKEIAKSNHELNVKIVIQHETYDHGKYSSKPSRAYYTDYMKDDGWQVSSFEHVEGQWEMALLRSNLDNQPQEIDWHVKGRILIFSPPFARPEEHEDVEEEEPPGGDDDEEGNGGQEPPGDDEESGDGPSGGPSKRTKTEITEMAKPVETAEEIPKEEKMDDALDAEPVEPFHGCTAIDPSNAPKEELSDDDVVTMSTRSTPDRPTSSREVLDRDKFIMSRFQGEIELSSDSDGHAFVALDHRTMNKGEKQVFVAGLQTLRGERLSPACTSLEQPVECATHGHCQG